MIKKLFIITTLFSLIAGVAMAIEEPKYEVESKTDAYEVRKYGSVLVAETTVSGTFEDAGNQAFRILADYIFGNNKTKAKIAMTAPVAQQNASEKISMTAPVSQTKIADGFLVQFTMPSKYTMQTLPEPNDGRVKLREIPGHKVAVYSYSGTWSESRYQAKLELFLSELKKNGIQKKGEPVFARYNPPFMPWFLRRNEIWVEISDNTLK